jgi:hypothetical protein
MRGKEAFAPATGHTSGYSAIKLIKRTKERKISMQRPQPIRFLLIVLVALFALAPHAAVFAGQPGTQALTPPPPSFETCKAIGDGTICQGDHTANEGLVDTGIVCGSGPSAFEIFDSGINHENAIHSYNDAGKLTRSVSHDNWSATQWSNPLAGTTLPYIQHMVFTTVLAVPGDLSTATNTAVGEVIFTPAHSQPILLGVGKQVFAPDGTLQFSAGHFIDLNSPELLPICAALA